VALQFFHHCDPEDALLGRVMENMDTDKGEKYISHHFLAGFFCHRSPLFMIALPSNCSKPRRASNMAGVPIRNSECLVLQRPPESRPARRGKPIAIGPRF
jgi:hypothetical protein